MKITIIDQEGKERVIEAEGQEVRIDLSKKEDRGSRWDRVHHDHFFCITDYCYVAKMLDASAECDKKIHNAFNYCRDKATMELRAKRERLMHEMEVWRDKNDFKNIDYNNYSQLKYFLRINNHKEIYIDTNDMYFTFNQIYFSSETIAEKAIIVFGDRLLELAQEEMK